jgi:hypothetical protein
VRGEGEDGVITGTAQSKEGALHVVLDVAHLGKKDGCGIIDDGECPVGTGESAVESGKGEVALEVEGREAKFAVRLGDGATAEEEKAGVGGIEGRLEGLEMFGVTEDDQDCEGVDGNGGVPDEVEEEGALLSEVHVVVTGLLESGVGELDGLDDLVAMGLEGEFTIDDAPR